MNTDDGSDQADGSPDRDLSCHQVTMSSSGLAELESHQESYREERPYKCNQCDKSYRHAGSLVNHKKTHQVGLYTCLICQKEYSNPMGLKSHLRTHSEEKRFKCEQCGEAFRMSQQLYNHRKSLHAYYSTPNGEKITRSPKFDMQSPVLVESSNLMTNLENYIAESMLPVDFPQLVSKYYPDEKAADESPVKEEAVEYEASTDEKDQPNDSNVEEYRYKCTQCGKAYKHAGSLANHRQSHVIGVYQCTICFKEFSNLMAMKNHCRLHSDSRSRRSCKSPLSSGKSAGVHLDWTAVLQSAKRPPSLPDLSKQIKSEDKDAVPIPETHCQDGPESSLSPLTKPNHDEVTDVPFGSDSMIESTNEDEAKEKTDDFPEYDDANEEETKSGDRPFTCRECGKSYRHAGSLINHKKIHQTGVYSCSLCSKKMFNMAALKNHLRAHFKSKAGRRLDDAHFPSADEIYQNQDDAFECGNSDISTNESDFLKYHFLHQKEEINEVLIDKPVEEVPESGIWQETAQVSQGSSDDSAYSSGPAVPEAKMEMDSPAFQSCSREDSLATQHDVKLEHEDDDLQNANTNVEMPHPDPITLKEEESSNLEDHHQSPDDRPHKCELCGRTYRHKSSLINHRLTHKTGIYQCSICPKQYSNLMALRNHVRFHSRSYAGRKSIASRQGHQFFRARPRFLQSKNSHSLADAVKLNEKIPQAVTTSLRTGEDLLNEAQILCTFGMSFNHSENFQSLRRSCPSAITASTAQTPTNIQCTSPGKDLLKVKEKAKPQGKATETSTNQGRRVYKCNLCSKSYRHSGSLINHKRTHQTGDYVCPYCSKHVHNMAALKNHIRIHHKIKKREPEELSVDQALLYSGLSYPPGDRGVYGCVSCRDTFHTESELLAHQMVHVSLEGNQWGDQAPKSSSSKGNKDVNFTGMEDSEWEHSNNLGFQGERDRLDSAVEDPEPEYTCVECGEVYDHIDDLNDHKRSHQAGIFQCSFCPKEYPSLSALRSHFETHTKPQTLRTTGIDGSEGSDFVDHQIPADSRYDCGHCGLIFSNEGDFHQHQVAHEKQQGMAESLPAMQREGQEAEFSFSMHSSERELLNRIKSEMEETERSENHDGASQLSHICGFCGETYDDLESLQAHSFSHLHEEDSSTNENNLPESDESHQPPCPKPKVEGAESSPNNGDSPERRPYTCEQCGKTYRHGGSLVNHKKTHLVGNFQCVACSRHYPNLAAYRTHLRHHPNCKRSSAVNELQTSTIYPSGNQRALPFSPSLPGDSASQRDPEKCTNFTTSVSQTSHTTLQKKTPRRRFSRQIGRISEDQTTQQISSQSTFASGALSVEDSKVQPCKLCGKMFRVKDLAMHLSSHCVQPSSKLHDNLVECKEEIHNLPISSNIALSQNDRETGFQKRPFRCEVCSRSYRHAGSLINHKQTHKTGVFRCPICQKRFFNLMAMKNHNRIHFELKRHKCLDCGKAFRLQKQLDTHQRIHRQRAPAKKLGRRNRKSRYRRFAQGHHQKSLMQVSSEASSVEKVAGELRSASRLKSKMDPDSRPYQCQECGRSYRHAGSLFNHKKSHKTGQYHCSICDKTYRNLMALKNHQRTHYEAKIHPCPQCGKTFKWRRQLSRHQLVHVQKGSQSVPLKPSGTEDAKATPDKQEVDVKGHEATSSNNEDVSNEADELESRPYEEINNDVSAESAAREPSPSEGPQRCDVCGHTDHAAGLCTHMNSQERGKYKCSVCPKEFLNPIAMDTHLQTHSPENHLQGVNCEQTSPSSHNTVQGNPCRCPICNRDFSCDLTLRHHQRTHQHLSSPQSSALVSSRPNHENKTPPSDEKLPNHKDQGDRKYKCKQCGRSYLHASSLFNHQKTHSIGVYKCPHCLKEFFNLLAFKNHLRIHRYICKECGKAFRNSSDLLAHSETHQGGSFTCSLCNKHFLCRSSLQKHQRIHDNQDGDILDPQAVSIMVEVT